MGFFTDGGTPSASFDQTKGFQPGWTWSGTITWIGEEVQATEFGTGNPKFGSKSGKPIMEKPIVIQTEQVQPTVEDDGKRSIYFGGEKKSALRAAIFAYPPAERREPEVGDWIALTWTGIDATNNQKLFTAQWKPGPGGQFFTEQQSAPNGHQAQPQQTATQQFPATGTPQAPPQQVPQPQRQQWVPNQQQVPQQQFVQQAAAAGFHAQPTPPQQVHPVTGAPVGGVAVAQAPAGEEPPF